MVDRYVLLTNNSTFAPEAGVDLELIEGGALDVFFSAKRHLHEGCRLLHHPLYGNFTPSQQPYRSLLMTCPDTGPDRRADMESCRLLEAAIERYGSRIHNLPNPGDYPASIREDYAHLDRTLVEEILLTCGVLRAGGPGIEAPAGKLSERR